jgi:putative ABC transport system permease protein
MFAALIARIRALLNPGALERDIRDELESHLAREMERLAAAGLTPAEASAEARRQFGNVTLERERAQMAYGWTWLESFSRDVRHALRALHRSPGFSAAAIFTLTLGIGLTVALFQLVNALQFRPLPVSKPSELVSIQFPHPGWYPGNWDSRYPELSYPLYEVIRARQHAFSGMFAWGTDQLIAGRNLDSHPIEAVWVTGNFFNVLGVRPLEGRLLATEDDRAGCPATAVVSYDFWNRELRQQPSMASSAITLEGQPVQVLGVTPAAFRGVEIGHTFDVALPTCARPVLQGGDWLNVRTYFWLAAGGRLKEGWTLARARQEMAAIAPTVFAETVSPLLPPDVAARYRSATLTASSAASGFSTLRDEYQRPLLITLTIAALVLLIGSMNLGGFVLARTTTRRREIAARLALGASRGRIIRQLVLENLALAVIGALGGLCVSAQLSELLASLLATHANPVFLELTLDWRTVAFASSLGALTCVLFGIVPAIRISGLPLSAVLNASARSITANRERRGAQRAFGVAQVAFSVILCFAAILLGISARRLVAVDPGFKAAPVLVVTIDLKRVEGDDAAKASVKRDILDRVERVSAVTSVADARQITWGDFFFSQVLDSHRPNELLGETAQNWVGPKYFATLGIPIVAGREFDGRDTAASPKVTIVNEEFVRTYLPNQPPLGAVVFLGRGRPFTVVGVVKNTKYRALREEFQPVSYLAADQNERPYLSYMLYVASAAMRTTAPLLRKAIMDVAPGARVDIQGFQEQLLESLLRERLVARLAGSFALAGGLLLCVGLYGSSSLLVSSRRQEFGIRTALGAQWYRILWPVMREALAICAAGALLGLPLALAAATVLHGLLYEVSPFTPVVLFGSCGAMLFVTLAASCGPALGACRADPIKALRID